MIRFYDGPARSEILFLRRAPKLLRVVHSRRRGYDALDQLADAPRDDETIYAYAIAREPTYLHVKACGKGKGEIGGFWAQACYSLVQPQPDESTLRDNTLWQEWCLARTGARPPATSPERPAPAPQPSPPHPRGEAGPPRTLLIDGDAIAWRVAYYARTGADAARAARQSVDKLTRDLGAGRAIVCLSDPSRRYFRHELFASYKPRQKDRPAVVDDALDILRKTTISRALPGLEADDVCGILATCPDLAGERVIVADDKDLLTVPGRHYRQGKLFDVSPAAAGCRHLYQTLIGDAGDGYPGCPGVGPKKAEQVLNLDGYAASPAGAWRAVVAAFERAGRTADDALLQARLARICRHEDYDVVRREVRPWTPPVDVARSEVAA